jgi:hypothetical protein
MNHQQTRRAAAALTLVAGAIIGSSGPAAATSSDRQGCASGQTTYETSFLIANGFSAEFLAQIDVNGDGIVCAKPLSPQQQEKFCSQFPDGCALPVIMAFSDNTRGVGY